MSAYASLEAIKEARKVVPMSSRMKQVAALLEAIEEIKRKIAVVRFNDNMPYLIKTTKLAEMRAALLQTEHHTLGLMQEELNECGSIEDGEDDDE